MKFVHIADMHFDSPFTTLSDKGNLGEKRRIEQRKIFKKPALARGVNLRGEPRTENFVCRSPRPPFMTAWP